MHVILIYALVTGLARNIVEVIKQPLETKIIEEVKEKPPEPPPPPPKLNIPPPPFIPPPEIQIQSPISSGPTISTVTNKKPVVEAPKPVAAAPAPPAVRRNPTPTFKVAPTYPRKAIKDNIEGSVEANLTVNGNGDVTDVKIVKSQPRGMFDEVAIEALKQYKFKGDGTQWVGIIEINFKLQD
jgi:periplasmic protein TonB